MLQHLGLLSLILITAGLIFTVLRWPAGIHQTFSQHAAATRNSAMYYSFLFMVTLPLLYLFLAKWFAPTFALGKWFVAIAAVSIAAQVICTFFPETGGWSTKVHRVITGLSGVLMLPLVAIVAMSAAVLPASKLVAWGSLVGMVALLIIALRYQQGYRYALYLQIGYYALFFITLLTVTYLR